MNIASIKSEALSIIQSSFPNYFVRIEEIPNDESAIGIGVFRVPTSMVAFVEEKIEEIDERLCKGTDFTLIAFVRDEAVTETYYKALADQWSLADYEVSIHDVKAVDVDMSFGQTEFHVSQYTSPFSIESAANFESALAA